MEKFRKFGDAATGVNPFTFVIAPTTLGRIGATLMYPMRLLFCTLFFLLVLILDVLSYVLYSLYLGILGRVLIGPLQRVFLRALLFFHGHLIPTRAATETDRAVLLSRKGVVASSPSSGQSPRAGDLVVCNMQSVWDVAVLEVALGVPYHAVAFPIQVASSPSGADEAESGLVHTDVGVQKRQREAAATTDDPVVFDDGNVSVKVFWPGPLQRWRVWAYVRRTGRLSFLKAQVDGAASPTPIMNVIEAQRQARRRGIALWCFSEGTCTNGKGLLKMPTMRLTTSAAAGGGPVSDKECLVWTAMTTYDTPALQNIVSEKESVLAFFYRAGLLLYGSTNANWSSPFFPSAEVMLRAVPVPTGSGARSLRRLPDRATSGAAVSSSSSSTTGPWPWELSAAGVDALRTGMCQRPKSAVVSTAAGAGAGANSRRYPLSVGMVEKLGYVEAYVSM